VAVVAAFAFPVLLLGGAMAIDTTSLNNQKSRMQSVADATALAVAKELHLLADEDDTLAAGRNRAHSLLAEVGLSAPAGAVTIVADKLARSVDVEITLKGSSLLPAGMTGGPKTLTVDSQAQSYGQVRLCVLGMNRTSSDTVIAQNGAVLIAPDCALQSNSSDPNGMVVKNLSNFTSAFTCTSGGYSGSLMSYLPPPQTDCAPLSDPLADRLAPSATNCDFRKTKISGGTKQLTPGVYCDGITITNKAVVTLAPGDYIIKGGKLEVGNKATLKGDYVSFYFADDAATFLFKDESVIELGASKEGPMAGLLFFENPKAAAGRSFEISSINARKLLGTIYLPRGVFKTDGSGTIAAASAYTVIVANRVDITSSTLVINADYGTTDVPVPSGLGPSSGHVRLVE
jgi:hypothetical protein